MKNSTSLAVLTCISQLSRGNPKRVVSAIALSQFHFFYSRRKSCSLFSSTAFFLFCLSLSLRLFLRLTRLNPRHGQIGSTDVTSSFVLAFLFLPPFAFPTRSSRFTTLGGDVQNLLTETLFGECAFSFEFRHSDVNSHVLNVSEFSIRPIVDAARD